MSALSIFGFVFLFLICVCGAGVIGAVRGNPFMSDFLSYYLILSPLPQQDSLSDAIADIVGRFDIRASNLAARDLSYTHEVSAEDRASYASGTFDLLKAAIVAQRDAKTNPNSGSPLKRSLRFRRTGKYIVLILLDRIQRELEWFS